MSQCPNCQTPVDEAAGFCDQCGYPLAPGSHDSKVPQPASLDEDPSGTGALSAGTRTFPVGIVICSACGKDNMPGEMFCQSCGVQLPPVASLPPPPPTPLSEPLRSSRPVQTGLSQEAGRPRREPAAGDQAWEALELVPRKSLPTDRDGGRAEGKLLLHGSQVEILLPLSRTELVIGRSDPLKDIYPDVDLTPYEGERSGVSRRHARIERDEQGIYLIDLNSTNFSFINRMKLQPGQRYPLKDGDEIRLGLFVIEYRSV